MSFFPGKYFDGKSSKKQDIKISLEENAIHFHTTENLETVDKRIWKIENIKVENIIPTKHLMLSYGDFPKQEIQIFDEEKINLIVQKYPVLFKNNFFGTIFGNNGAKILTTSIVLVIFFFGFFYKIIFPFITTKIVKSIPISTEISMGNKMVNSFLSQRNDSINSINKSKTILINKYFSKTKFKSNYPIKIYFVNEAVVNAFAFPGGSIFIYKGILDKIKSSEELSALIAHELAHIEKRHSLLSLTKSLSNYFFLSIVTSDMNGIALSLIDSARMLKNLSNSRDFEKEADLVSLNYLITNNLSPKGLINLMKNIGEEKNNSNEKFNLDSGFSYLSTHPNSSERIKYIKAKIKDKKIENTVFPIKEDLNNIFNLLKK